MKCFVPMKQIANECKLRPVQELSTYLIKKIFQLSNGFSHPGIRCAFSCAGKKTSKMLQGAFNPG
jgi:hypothetical protein